MPATNILANLFGTLYNNEARRNTDCVILPTSKLGIEVLKSLQKHGYIGEFEHIDDKRSGVHWLALQFLPPLCWPLVLPAEEESQRVGN